MSGWLRWRWLLDRVFASLFLVLAAPVAAATWLAIRLSDGAPGVVRLARIGRGGAQFQMLKFRSMTVTGEDGSAGGPALTTGADPRVTRLGRRLRHYRLDELPQLANVARGQMSLLGPRPETPCFVDLDDPRWQQSLRARPGIAGPTQVLIHDLEAGIGLHDLDRYRDEILPVKLAVDIWYVTNASPSTDFSVVIALVERFVLRQTVTTLRGRLAREVPQVAELLALHGLAGSASAAVNDLREQSVPLRADLVPGGSSGDGETSN